jgi:hypothetical protein
LYLIPFYSSIMLIDKRFKPRPFDFGFSKE